MEESQDLTPVEAHRLEELHQLDHSEEESLSEEQRARVAHRAARPEVWPVEPPSAADAPRTPEPGLGHSEPRGRSGSL